MKKLNLLPVGIFNGGREGQELPSGGFVSLYGIANSGGSSAISLLPLFKQSIVRRVCLWSEIIFAWITGRQIAP